MSALDRDAAREVLRHLDEYGEESEGEESALDALEACVRLAPLQGIDRDALEDELTRSFRGFTEAQVASAADRVLALLRPVDGVVLTREECEFAADWHDYIVDHDGEIPAAETEIALRLRAGAAS